MPLSIRRREPRRAPDTEMTGRIRADDERDKEKKRAK